MTSAIKKVEPSIIDTLTNAEWTRDVFEVIRKLRVPKGCTEEEFYVYLKQCQASGLNPLLGHAYCVPRRTNIAPKGQPAQWVTNHVFQPAIDGMRARAAEFPDFDGVDSAPIYEKDVCTINKGTGDINHVSAPTANRGRLVGAWGRVRKVDGKAYVVELPVSARAGDSSFWQGDPGGMLAKCCEAAALRKAYPRAFGGMHIREEVGGDEAAPTRAEVVMAAATGEAPTQDMPALPAVAAVVEFGEWRGRPISGLAVDEKQAAIRFAEEQVAQHPKMAAKAKAKLLANVEALRAALGEVKGDADVVDAEEVPTTSAPLPMSHPDAEPPEDVGANG
jgi:phage recombination protein Bet